MSSPLDRIEAQIRNYIPVRPNDHGADCMNGNCGAHTYLTALVNIAKAAEKLTGQPFGQLSARDFWVLRERLAALGKEPA